jgi:undecaprenyl-diphosphatase
MSLAVNGFDLTVLHFVNQFVGRWPELDRFVAYLSWQNILKGGMLAALVWWAWFSGRERAKELMLSSLIGSLAALAVARLLASTLRFRVRPLADPQLGFRVPEGIKASQFIPWSSFPSDHAVLFIGLATGLCLVSTKVGIAALAYTALVILVPRLYGGLHYPTDLIAGGLLGAVFVLIACSRPLIEKLSRPLLVWEKGRPATFYAALFVASFEVAELFEGARNCAQSVLRFVARLHR